MSDIALDEVIHFDITTRRPSTGAIANADSTPTFAVFEEANDTPILSAQSYASRSLTGQYRGTVTVSAANGFDVGKWYNIVTSATMDAVSDKDVTKTFRVGPAEAVAGYPKVDTYYVSGVAPSSSNDVADAFLTRDWASVTGEAARSVLNALRFLRNKWIVTGDTLSVKKEDDTTEAWSGTLSTSPSAQPIVGQDPS